MPELHITGNAEADQLLNDDPLALLIGTLLDQRVRMELAYSAPLKIKERTRAFSAEALADYDSTELAEVFRQTPAIHRYPKMMAERTQALCRVIADKWGGDAAQIWQRDDPDGAEVLRRLKALPGFGPLKSKIFLALLGKQLGFTGEGWRQASAPHGREGIYGSVANVRDAESMQLVRNHIHRRRR